jgi:hypothetical protein
VEIAKPAEVPLEASQSDRCENARRVIGTLIEIDFEGPRNPPWLEDSHAEWFALFEPAEK